MSYYVVILKNNSVIGDLGKGHARPRGLGTSYDSPSAARKAAKTFLVDFPSTEFKCQIWKHGLYKLIETVGKSGSKREFSPLEAAAMDYGETVLLVMEHTPEFVMCKVGISIETALDGLKDAAYVFYKEHCRV